MTVEHILTMIDGYLEKEKKQSPVYRTLKLLKKDIQDLIKEEETESGYHCTICRKISLKLKDKKYCLECFDKFID